MSASLVGSEMCIRDSPKSARTRAASKVAGRDAPPRAEPRISGSCNPGRSLGCLLYTSDAADDMQ
eukprot:5064879-Alexandrium_andersonii.AAC.1